MNRLIGICVLTTVVSPAMAEADSFEATTPVAQQLPSAAPPLSTSAIDDHLSVVGRWAVGYQGISSLPIAGACCDDNGRPQVATVDAPVVGVRHWFRETLGVDAGVGFRMQTASSQASAYGFALHAGLPIVLGRRRHTAFEITPEATVGFTTGTIPAPTPTVGPGSVSGALLRAGARAGAEVHFGFIGLP